MITTTAIILALIFAVILDTLSKIKVKKDVSSNEESIDQLFERVEAVEKLQLRNIQEINKNIESLRLTTHDLRDKMASSVSEQILQRISSNETSTANLYADLDRTIAAVDQVQHRIEEMQVLIQNSINELRG